MPDLSRAPRCPESEGGDEAGRGLGGRTAPVRLSGSGGPAPLRPLSRGSEGAALGRGVPACPSPGVRPAGRRGTHRQKGRLSAAPHPAWSGKAGLGVTVVGEAGGCVTKHRSKDASCPGVAGARTVQRVVRRPFQFAHGREQKGRGRQLPQTCWAGRSPPKSGAPALRTLSHAGRRACRCFWPVAWWACVFS